MSKTVENALILDQREICPGIFSMTVRTGIAKEAVPGQFVSLYCHQKIRLLPRPISICEIDRKEQTLRLVYRVGGEGTREFSTYQKGDNIRLMGPLGNGFPLSGGSVLMIGGGIGIPPLVALGRELKARGSRVVCALGYRDVLFLADELTETGELLVATEDGSAGVKGTVIDALLEKEKESPLDFDMICACGPTPMLRAVSAFAKERGIPCYISMEERMACGIGACLACTCESTEKDEHTMVNKKRICKDGPVFLSTEVKL